MMSIKKGTNMADKCINRKKHADTYLQNDVIIFLRETNSEGSSAESHRTHLGVTAVREIPDFVPIG